MARSKYRFGPALATFTAIAKPEGPPPVDPHPVEKADVEIEIRRIFATDYPTKVTVGTKPYDPARSVPVKAIHLVIVPVGHGQPSTADDAMASSYPKFTTDVSGITDGSDIEVDLVDLPAEEFMGLSVIEDVIEEEVIA